MSKDNCRTSKTQLPKSWAVENRCASGCTKQLPHDQKTTAELQNTTAELSKNKCQNMKKQVSKSQKTKISTYLKITTFKNLSPNLKKKKKIYRFLFHASTSC